MTSQELYGEIVLGFFTFEELFPSFINITLFTPETPKAFCGLKHFTHPSISPVVNYPFKEDG